MIYYSNSLVLKYFSLKDWNYIDILPININIIQIITAKYTECQEYFKKFNLLYTIYNPGIEFQIEI
jgi:hypothetical protein